MHHRRDRFEVIVLNLLTTIIRRLDIMAIDLSRLVAEVAAVKDASASAVVLINGIADRIDEAVAAATGMDPVVQAEIDRLTDELKASAEALGAAVTANTPHAEPDPVVDPAPVEEPAPVVVDPVAEEPVVDPVPVVEEPVVEPTPEAPASE
jgi:hypothetical protein